MEKKIRIEAEGEVSKQRNKKIGDNFKRDRY